MALSLVLTSRAFGSWVKICASRRVATVNAHACNLYVKGFISGCEASPRNDVPCQLLARRMASTNRDESRKQSGEISKVSRSQTSGQVTIGERVKETTKDVYYAGIIIVGVGITGVIVYYIFRELFSSQSPNGVYTCAFKECRESPRIVDAVGEPMKGYGELSSRGRRRHVSHIEYMMDDVKCMRMKFYIEGSRRKGTVHLEVKQNESGKYDYRYLFVELDGYPRETIILKDNR